MILDIIISFLLIAFSVWSFHKGWTYPYDKSYSSWDMKKRFYVMSIGTLFIAILIMTGKVHVLDFFD